jgi:hypothetical protein
MMKGKTNVLTAPTILTIHQHIKAHFHRIEYHIQILILIAKNKKTKISSPHRKYTLCKMGDKRGGINLKTPDVNGISKASAFVCFAQSAEQLQLNTKPRLTASEACHRLVPDEGQKENK